MHSPFVALTWEIWQRHRRLIGVVAGITMAGWLFQWARPGGREMSLQTHEHLLLINSLLLAACLFLVFGMFRYTEFNRQKAWTGFPYRLFSLPVKSVWLVGLPMGLGVTTVVLVNLLWVNLIFVHTTSARAEWIIALTATYLVFFQSILWSLAGFRTVRLIVLGLVGTSFVGVFFLPFLGESIASPWLSEKALIPLLVGLAGLAFVLAWNAVARQRCDGGYRRQWFRAVVDRLTDILPRSNRSFATPSRAQFWYEWRQAGGILPLATAVIVVVVVAPISWYLREEPGETLWILAWTLATPVLLAVPIGKAFSKPDFWSGNLTLPPFLSTRPLSTGDWVVIKLKVAALSAALAWLIIVLFLALWLCFWANLSALSGVRIGYWMVYDRVVYPQYAVAALALSAGAFLTWKLLVGGLWIGLSGSSKLYISSAAAYCVVVLGGLICLLVLLEHDVAVRRWVRSDPNRLIMFLEWSAAVAIMAKLWLAARTWRHIGLPRVRTYLLLWTVGTLCLVTLGLLLWAKGLLSVVLMAFADFLPLDIYRLRNLLILAALLVIPLARPGLAPAFLAKNRHR